MNHNLRTGEPVKVDQPLRLLIAENTDADAELMINILKGAGYAVTFVRVNKLDAFSSQVQGADYDVILSGHNIGDWTGINALDVVKKSVKKIPLIVVTPTLGDEAAVNYINLGASDYVLKDRLDRLPAAVERVRQQARMAKEHSQLQEKILRAKRDWEMTFDAVPDPIFVIGEDCCIQRANRAASKVFGLAFDQMIGRPCYEVIHGRTTPLDTCPHQCQLNSGENSKGDIEEARLGKVFHTSTSPLRDPAGVRLGSVHVLHDVTDRKRTEEALRRQALTFENIYDAVIVVDLDFNIVDWNPAATRLFGYEKEEAVGRNISIVHYPDVAERQMLSIKAGIMSAGRWEGEYAFARKDGTRGIAEIVIVPFLDVHGTPVGTVGVTRDITKRKRTEQALRDSEEKYRLLFDSNPQPMWVYDVSSLRFLSVNQAAIDHYGYSRSEFLSMTLKAIRPPEDVPALVHSVLSFKEGIDRASVWRHRTKDGRDIDVEITDCRIDLDGQPASLVLAIDVTEQKQAERELRESEAKYRELIENATYGIFRVTMEGEFLDVNPAFVKMLGYDSKEELLRVNLETDIYEDLAERQETLRVFEDDQVVRVETSFKRKDGALIRVRIDGRGVGGPDKKVHYFEEFVEDVTQQKDLEEQLRQAQKMEAVGRLAGGIAHDFNNVLMIINSYAELITNRQTPDPAIQRYMKQIIQAGKKATSLTSKLLAFSRKQVLQPVVLDLRAVITDLGNMLVPMLGEDVEMTVAIESDLGNVYADRAQIEQVLMNLAVNARDAMPKGGKLRIELNNVAVDDQYIQRHPQIAPGAYVVLAVSDTGAGMDAATQARIFEPFFTTKGVGKGTGLGLSTVYGIVNQSSGFIWVYSELGLGTTFKVYLPRVFEQVVAPGDTKEERRDHVGNGETVLLVDDEPDLRSAAREFLEGKGYRVLEAESGAGALGVCTGYRGPIQVLVTDLIMPGMRGPELAAKIAKLYPEIKTVYMSGYTDRSQDLKDLGKGAVFLQKPFSLNALVAKLYAALHGETLPSVRTNR